MTLTCRGELEPPATPSGQLMLTIGALFCGLVLSALWGLGAGSASAALALSDVFKVPMVILLSALTALPAGVVALKLANAKLPASELVNAFATSLFGGTLVLATLAPLVAIYYHTSARAGVPLALGSVFVALVTATLLFARAVKRKLGAHAGPRLASIVPVAILVTLFSAALLQYVALASPIIPADTAFSGGLDTVLPQ
jgi:hypothetical protein|nr:hypothetical protein [Kofleriaceae bacterium]